VETPGQAPVLLVSTDPASNLDDVPLGNLPAAVPGAECAA
jgi:anion-transporting  ArsA/GET3 family ATPase